MKKKITMGINCFYPSSEVFVCSKSFDYKSWPEDQRSSMITFTKMVFWKHLFRENKNVDSEGKKIAIILTN